MDEDALLDAAVAMFRTELVRARAALKAARNAAAFTVAERDVVRLSQAFASDFVRRTLQELSDDASRVAEATVRVREKSSRKGISMRNSGMRSTQVRTLGGATITVSTPYMCAVPRGDGVLGQRGRNGTGVYPVLDQLGISERSTPALRLLVSRAMCEANSISAGRELLEAGGVSIDHKAALRLTYAVCEDAVGARRDAMKALKAGVPGPLSGHRVVVALDGGRVQIRRRVAGRPKKGGRKHFVTEWREPKVITIYRLDGEGRMDRSKGAVRVIDGTLGDADDAFALALYYLKKLGAHQASHLTVIGDGAEWIWNRSRSLMAALGLKAEQYKEILDYFHASERLSDFSKAAFRSRKEEERLAWLHVQKKLLKAGDVEAIEASISAFGRRKVIVKKELPYWDEHRGRLRFGQFRSMKLTIGSGAVESSVRRVVNLRMKGASVTWLEEHAEGILHLRSHAKSGQWTALEDAVLARTGWRPTTRQTRKDAV